MNTPTVSSPDTRDWRRANGASWTTFVLVLLVFLAGVGYAFRERLAEAPEAAMPLVGERFLAANPELMLARRYAEGTVTSAASPSSFLARNPELSAFWRYQDWLITGPAFLARNPELSTVQRGIAEDHAPARAFLAENPELSTVWRFSAVASSSLDDSFLAQNPEFSAARRYATPQITK